MAWKKLRGIGKEVDNDLHIVLVSTPNHAADESGGVAAEAIPHLRTPAWDAGEIAAVQDYPLRIRGPLT
jgi:hypothetical protein